MNVDVFIDGKAVPMQAITKWERKRTDSVARFLQSSLKLPIRDITRDINGPRDMIAIRKDLTKIKTVSASVSRSPVRRVDQQLHV